ncbi:uncharacterized protein LOC114574249 [Exaiptasia diaphana]|uniref:EGF-like domain-containing protein n=1 Tax=Exaiptasia diaphana TaxID=2652724 RepID=A0A913WUW3_EXADI|nr:uncharacterized protein LOC114574249 [Exaiptasia diaphana]
MVTPGVCYNGCCRSQPCMNGGTCVERCHSPLEKFTCECQNRYTGRVCEKRITECFDIRKYASPSYVERSKIFVLARSDNGQEISVYCSIFANSSWTLVESFAFVNNLHYRSKAFFDEASQTPTAPNWSHYRLSLEMMKYLRSKTTIFSATCSFERKNNRIRPDFVLATFSEFDPMKQGTTLGSCFKALVLNIRGHEFTNQKIPIWQQRNRYHPHIDGSSGYCGFPLVPGSVGSEDSFGYYRSGVNRASTCVNNDSATTNWWFGNSFEFMSL